MKSELLVLRGKIKGLALESEKIRGRINKFRTEVAEKKQEIGNKRNAEWMTKRQVGYETRYLALAYGFIRGVPYRKMERKTLDENRPSAELLFKIITEHTDYFERRKWTLERVKELLSEQQPEPLVEAAKQQWKQELPKRVALVDRLLGMFKSGEPTPKTTADE